MTNSAWRGPLSFHIALGLAALSVLAIGHQRASESYVPLLLPPVVVVWLLLGVVVVILARAPGPLRFLAWTASVAFPPLALGVALGFFRLLG